MREPVEEKWSAIRLDIRDVTMLRRVERVEEEHDLPEA